MPRFRRTTLITIFCLAVLAGIGLSKKFSYELGLAPALPALGCLLLLKPKNITGLILVLFLGLSLGLWRGGTYVGKLDDLKSLATQRVTIQAIATSDSVYGNRAQIDFTGKHAKLISPYKADLAGSFRLSGFGERMIYRGDVVNVTGKLYPTRGSNQARIAYAQLQKVSSDKNWINSFTRRFSAGMQSALPEPQASFGLGLLIGQRSTIPQEVTNQLIMVGLVHIVAVSGYNLTILVRATSRLKMRSKYQQLVLSLSLIVAFVLMTGFSASIVRAAIVSGLGLWAWFYGRELRPFLLIAFAAAITGFINPFYVWGDLSWYLSFLAFFGVLIVSPLIAARLFKHRPKILALVVLETLSAELMTLPLIMMTFSQLSLIGLVANALVVPLVPLAMLLSAIAAAAGMLIPAFAGWLAWPANYLLTYMLDVAHLLSGLPSIFLHRSISLQAMLGFYAAVLLLFLGLHKHHNRLKTAIITDEKVIQGA